ncbi:MAG: VOC family protein [Betaproteobacteria bacterium]|nr:VOC family protein [Betaproteobacteria bacterium]
MWPQYYWQNAAWILGQPIEVIMRVQALGHVVLKVRNLDRSLAFFNGVLGLPVVARTLIRDTPMAFFSIAGNHHDLALMELGSDAPSAREGAPGLAHVALKIGNSMGELRAALQHLQARGIAIDRTADHIVAQSLYIHDPDGNRIELYVDADPRIWRENPSSVAHSEPLDL